MRIACKLHDDQCADHEASVFYYTCALRDGIDPTTSLPTYEHALLVKQYMWIQTSQWCRTLLKNFYDRKLDSTVATTFIPDLIRVPHCGKKPARYRTATGCLQLLDPAQESMDRFTVGYHELDIPMQHMQR
jgi:hypothetical protein